MIEVTRLNGNPMMVNSDLIKLAEASPDTMLTLIHGEKLIVRETCDEIAEKIMAYRSELLAAVAARVKSPADLHRVVALSSLSPDSSTERLATGGLQGAAMNKGLRAVPSLSSGTDLAGN
jgi:flagellar protein FlbD